MKAEQIFYMLTELEVKTLEAERDEAREWARRMKAERDALREQYNGLVPFMNDIERERADWMGKYYEARAALKSTDEVVAALSKQLREVQVENFRLQSLLAAYSSVGITLEQSTATIQRLNEALKEKDWRIEALEDKLAKLAEARE